MIANTFNSNNYTLDLYDYPMWWVVCTSDLVMYTGDTDFAVQYYDTLKKTLDDYYGQNLTSNGGLLNKTNGYGDYAFLPRSGVITYYNALYVHALKSAAQLASILGHSDDSAAWTSRAADVGEKLLNRNWDTSVGAEIGQWVDAAGESERRVCDEAGLGRGSVHVITGCAAGGRLIWMER